MAAIHSSSLLSTPKPPGLDWHQEGSSSGEWSSKGGSQPSDIILPILAPHPLAMLHTIQTSGLDHEDPPVHVTNTVTTTTNTVSTDGHVNQPLEPGSDLVNQGYMHKLVRVPQVHTPVSVSTDQASSSSPNSPSTVVPNIDVQSTVRGAPNPLALMSSSGQTDRGDALAAQLMEPQKLSLEDPTDPSLDHSSLASLSSSFIDADPALGLKLREHARGTAQHAITSREVHKVNEPPTDRVSVDLKDESVPESPASPTSTSTTPTEISLNTTIIPDNLTAPNETTTEEAQAGQVVRGNGTDGAPLGHWSGTVTAFGGLLSNSSSVEETDAQGNSSEPSSTASGSFLNRQVPATTQDPSTLNNSSGHIVDSGTPVCMSWMDIVWIVLAISVPVSSCCK